MALRKNFSAQQFTFITSRSLSKFNDTIVGTEAYYSKCFDNDNFGDGLPIQYTVSTVDRNYVYERTECCTS